MPHTATPRTAAAKVLVTITGHYLPPLPPQETLKYSKAGLAQSAVQVTAPCPRSWCTQVSFACPKCLWRGWGLSAIASLLPSCFRFSFALGHEVSFFCVGSNILSMLFQQLIEILVFLTEKINVHSSTLPSYGYEMANRKVNRSANSEIFVCVCSKITAYCDWIHEIKRCLLLWREAMTGL